ncbi:MULTISPECIES: DUF493 family protein YbeD [unclassified Thalassotalea]|uniref:DUF493 family protein YbeD n=1 Tax=unclassified Thalassotalea TaxID=2614972 RepID=UPI0010810855|nr:MULTISPECIES: DUF493 family protein YbeD [unclassified Thalassotalea]NMP16854.1 YbeD family protein [Thalassotalea sp. Y01]QBY05487.1 DUF493 family protein [Thalassotalea sp. HSM 43]
MKARFDEIIEFPYVFNFKVMGLAVPNLPDLVVAVLQSDTPGDYVPTIKPSSKGTYHSVSVRVTVNSQAHIEKLYKELSAIEEVRYVL